MKKQKSLFGTNPIEELDLQHQGSVGGDQLAGSIARNVDIARSNLEEFGQSDFTPGREPAEGADVAMTSPSHERLQQKTPDRPPKEGQGQPKTEKGQQGKVHHYK